MDEEREAAGEEMTEDLTKGGHTYGQEDETQEKVEEEREEEAYQKEENTFAANEGMLDKTADTNHSQLRHC